MADLQFVAYSCQKHHFTLLAIMALFTLEWSSSHGDE